MKLYGGGGGGPGLWDSLVKTSPSKLLHGGPEFFGVTLNPKP